MNPEESEYQKQLFGFSVEEFIESNIMMIEQHIKNTTYDFIESVINKTAPNQTACDKIRKKFNEVLENINNNSSSTINKISNAAEKHFSIPDDVLLIEDMKHSKNITHEEFMQLSKKLEDLQQLFKENAFVAASLKQEVKNYDDLQPLIDKEKEISEKVKETFKNPVEITNESTIMPIFDKIMNTIQEKKNEAL